MEAMELLTKNVNWNRSAFMYDAKTKLDLEYHKNSVHIAQFDMYRDDIRDLVQLTVSKMDTYLIINTIQLALAIMMFTEGKPHPIEVDRKTGDASGHGWPLRTIWLYTLCTLGAILYFLLSAWLAMHASISAHTYGVRLLTQYVRLPVPTVAHLEQARLLSKGFESQSMQKIQVPFVSRVLGALNFRAHNKRLSNINGDDEFDKGFRVRATESIVVKDVEAVKSQAIGVVVEPGDTRTIQSMSDKILVRWDKVEDAGCPNIWTLRRSVTVMKKDAPPPVASRLDEQLVEEPGRLQRDQESRDQDDLDTSLQDPYAHINKKHIQEYRDVQAHWIAYDAYARVCMMMGANQLAYSVAYNCLAVFIIENRQPLLGFGVAMALICSTFLVIKLDVYTKDEDFKNLVIAGIIFSLGPILEMIALSIKITTHLKPELWEIIVHILKPVIFLMHILWMWYILLTARPEQKNKAIIPKDFGSVSYLDVFADARQHSEKGVELTAASLSEDCLKNCREAERRQKVKQLSEDIELCWRLKTYGIGRDSVSEYHVDQLECICQKFKEWVADEPDFAQQHFAQSNYISREFKEWVLDKTDFELANPGAAEGEMDAGASSENDPVWLELVYSDGIDYRCVKNNRHSPPPRLDERILSFSDLGTQLELLRTSQPRQVHSSSTPAEAAQPGTLGSCSESPAADASDDSSGSKGIDDGNDKRSLDPCLDEGMLSFSCPARSGGEEHGRKPWHHFRTGSQVLLIVWMLSFVWVTLEACSVVKPLWFDCPSCQIRHSHNNSKSSFLDVVFPGDWPHSFFKPTGLACHTDAGAFVLIAEKYGVHQLDLQSSQSSEPGRLRPALGECLASAPSFLLAGIDDISIYCDFFALGAGTDCFALLFSIGHPDALRCPLGDAGGAGTTLSLPGLHSWRSLVAGLHPDSFWGLSSKGIIELDRQASEALVPQSIKEVDTNVTKLQVLANSGSLLAMDGDGSIIMWPLRGGGQRMHSRLTQEESASAKWVGVCSIDNGLYAISQSLGVGPAKVWRRALSSALE